MAPTVNNASGATAVVGTSATLNGILTSGNSADIYVYWGTDPDNWSHIEPLGTLPDGMFSKTVSGLPLSTTHYYRCFASNSVGTAWASSTSSFVSAAQSFTWTGSGGNLNWNNAGNWDPNTRFPNLARETVCFSNGAHSVYLNQSTVTIGGINMTPNHWSDDGYNITTNAPGQSLVFDYGDGPAYIRTLDGRWASSTISAPIVLNNDVEVSTATAGTQYGLLLRGPITGPGKLIAKNAWIGLDPRQDTTYDITFSGTKTSGYLWKRGTKTATLTGTNSIALAGGWDDASGAVIGGGKLVLSGGILTNQTATTRAVLFRDAGNALIVTNGARLVNARGGNNAYFNKAGNEVAVTGEGSLWDLHGDTVYVDASSNRLTVADGGHVMNIQARIGWSGGSYNRVLVTGSSTLWNVGGSLSVGRNTTSNTLTIANGAVVENAWLWVGGYAYYEDGGGTGNGLVITNGGTLASGRDEGWGWGSCIGVSGVSGGRVDRNYALVTGAGSVWNLINRPLRIGYVTTAGAAGAWNRVWVEAGGALTNVNALYIGCTANGGASSSNELDVAAGGAVSATSVTVGDATSLGNTLTLCGGSLKAGALTVSAGNKLSPVIGAGGITAMTVTGTATFPSGSYVSPSAAVNGSPGTYTVLTASSIVNSGLALDPAADASRWSFAIAGGNTLKVTYRMPGMTILVR
jgi:T5SS/PEP-CTERM-associated repeat protein